MVIAGMGGETIWISSVPLHGRRTAHPLLLQPMTKVELLRGWLRETDTAAPRSVWCRTRGNCMQSCLSPVALR